MEDKRKEQKEALQTLIEYSPKLLKAMYTVAEELKGNRQPDTDEYLKTIINGMNWELQVVNGTIDYLNEEEVKIDKEKANNIIIGFDKVYKEKDDEKLSEFLKEQIIGLFEQIEAAAKEKA